MEVRQRASDVNPTSTDLPDAKALSGERILDHLTQKKQNLLCEAKKFKDRYHYLFC